MKLSDHFYSQLAHFIDDVIFPVALSIVLLIVVFKLLRVPVGMGLMLIYDWFGYGIFSRTPGLELLLVLILVPLCAYITYWLLVGSMYVYDKF